MYGRPLSPGFNFRTLRSLFHLQVPRLGLSRCSLFVHKAGGCGKLDTLPSAGICVVTCWAWVSRSAGYACSTCTLEDTATTLSCVQKDEDLRALC